MREDSALTVRQIFEIRTIGVEQQPPLRPVIIM
jgi:hypothetical protein